MPLLVMSPPLACRLLPLSPPAPACVPVSPRLSPPLLHPQPSPARPLWTLKPVMMRSHGRGGVRGHRMHPSIHHGVRVVVCVWILSSLRVVNLCLCLPCLLPCILLIICLAITEKSTIQLYPYAYNAALLEYVCVCLQWFVCSARALLLLLL
jgi:hypothetical protein